MEEKRRECGIDDLFFAFSAVLRRVRGSGILHDRGEEDGRLTPFEMHEWWGCEGGCVLGEV